MTSKGSGAGGGRTQRAEKTRAKTSRATAGGGSPALKRSAVDAWLTSAAITRFLLDRLDPEAWREIPPGMRSKTIASGFAHVHNTRRAFLSRRGKRTRVPAKLDGRRATRREVKLALARSTRAIERYLVAVDEERSSSWTHPDVVTAVAYLITHEAHHRGQICMMARQLGRPLSTPAMAGMWEWRKRAREAAS